MLGNQNQGLHYPRLVFITTEKIRHNSGELVTHPIYQLDWSKQEEACGQRPSGSYDTWWIPGLPLGYDRSIKELRFSVSEDYKDEINRMTRASDNEWRQRRPFDTMIRDICLEPAIAYIWTAFRLLADCVWDKEKRYFARGDWQVIVPYAFAYKFWRDQTGGGLVRGHARIDDLEYRLRIGCYQSGGRQHVRDFLDALEEHERWLEGRLQTISGPPVTAEEKVDVPNEG